MFRRLFKRRKDPASDVTSVGRVLVDLGYISADQLAHALGAQGQTGERLCTALVGLGVITKWQAQNALNEQKIRRGDIAPRAHLRIQRERNQRLAQSLAAQVK